MRSFFIRVLLDKKYALPYRVLDALVAHFLRFSDESRALPVVWHQSLLTFVQRYKQELAAADKERLRALAGTQRHYRMTPELLRELAAGQSRGEAASVEPALGVVLARTGGKARVHGRDGETFFEMPAIELMQG